MALSAFSEKAKKPRDADVMKILGRSGTHWKSIVESVAADFKPLDQTWGYAGADWGWSLRLKQKKRTILYLTPCHKYFVAGLVLGGKAVQAARRSDLPKMVLENIAKSKKYAEGTGVRIEVRNKSDREAVLALASIKMAN
jgi:hypothetical protein